MSSIDRLMIQGIRAFDPRHKEVIEFGTPLTLIVGHNGAGKTTIIEALRYATAGIFPPTCKASGQQAAFLHDPNIDHEREITAQIQFRIRTANQATVTCTRNLQVNKAKDDKLQFKALNGSVLVQRNGEKSSSSATVTQLDAQMPAWLGVSAAVLDRVIFCHQDESLWAMSASKDLKQYFDALFEIEKYGKAISELYKLAREKKTARDLAKKDEERCKGIKDDAARMRKQMTADHDEIDIWKAETIQLEKQKIHAESERNQAEERRSQAGRLAEQLIARRNDAKNIKYILDSMRGNLQELAHTTQELEAMAAQYEERSQMYEQNSEQNRTHINTLQKSIESTRALLSTAEQELGSNKARHQYHEQQLAARQDLIRKLAVRHEIRGYTGDISDHQIQTFSERMRRMAQDQAAALSSAKRDAVSELQTIQDNLDIINDRRATLVAAKDNAKKLMQVNERKLDQVQRAIDSVDADEGLLASEESKVSKLAADLAAAKSLAQAAGTSDAEARANAELSRLRSARMTLDAELREVTENMKETASLDLLKADLNARQQRLSTMEKAHKAALEKLIGTSWTPADVKYRFDTVAETARTALDDAKTSRAAANQQHEIMEGKVKELKAKIARNEATVKTAAAKISRVIASGPEGYHTELEELESSRDTIKADADSFEVLIRYLDQCIKDAQTHKVCRTCARSMKEKDVEILEKRMKTEKEKYDLGSTHKDLGKVEDDLREAKAVASDVETWERLTKTELPALQLELKTLEQQRLSLVQKLEVEDDAVRERESTKRDIDAASKNVTIISTLHSEIQEHESKIAAGAAKLGSIGLSRDSKTIYDERAKIIEQEEAIQTQLGRILSEKHKSEQAISRLELQQRDAQAQLDVVRQKLQAKAQKEEEKAELKEMNASHRLVVTDSDAKLDATHSELDTEREKHADATARAASRETQLQEEAAKVGDSINKFGSVSKAIQSYIDADGPGILARSESAVQEYKSQIKQSEETRLEIATELEAIEKDHKDFSGIKRNIDDNLRFRRETVQLKVAEEDIAELETHNAEAERDQHEAEAHSWSMKATELHMELTGLMAQIKTKDTALQRDVETYKDMYTNAAANYRKAHIQVEVTQACAKDLSTYANALDKAIMKFHTIKMNEINAIIDDLWRKTYQGTDVDTIFIESDAGGSSTKTYNYRVCMSKGATIMDMRGRCSAGQKVLACIIIRLALAECFGVNCGLIALDEPTTNLDTENAQALALSLAELIRARRAQKNFQLIIITHDEEFLKFMSPANYVDYYYRVSRTSKQKSHIEREQISYLMRH